MKTPFVTEIIKKIAPSIGASVLVEPEYGFVGRVTFKNRNQAFFRDRSFNINYLGSVEIARDKAYSSFFLRTIGYRVPEGQTFFSDKLNQNLAIKRGIDDGFFFASQLGFPVVVKPNSLSQGTLVGKVYNKRQYYKLARQILKRTSVLIVQKFHSGNDYRIVVLDDEVLSAYKRIPLSVTGDGKSSVRKLLRRKQALFLKTGRDTIIDVDDFRIKTKLQSQNLTLDSAVPKQTTVFLLDNANLSTGGDAIDVTRDIHPDFYDLAVRITRDMGLRLCGVDLITDDLTQPLNDYVVIEINGSPGLDNYASIGDEQAKVVECLYLKVLKALEEGHPCAR